MWRLHFYSNVSLCVQLYKAVFFSTCIRTTIELVIVNMEREVKGRVSELCKCAAWINTDFSFTGRASYSTTLCCWLLLHQYFTYNENISNLSNWLEEKSVFIPAVHFNLRHPHRELHCLSVPGALLLFLFLLLFFFIITFLPEPTCWWSSLLV